VAVVVALSVALIIYSSTVQLIPGFTALYVPISLASTVILAVLARRLRLRSEDLGLDPTNRRTGLTLGLAVGLVAVLAMAIGVAVPSFHPLFDDARIAGAGWGLVLYRAFVRIPLGTALFEEFAFRGVLYGVWSRAYGRWNALIGSSIVFGLWHMRPAVDLLDANDLAGGAGTRALALAGAVVATGVAGSFLCLLRTRTDSLWAPFVAHASINSMALIAAAIVN
jgi:membrane protease YdiL (CAAX protease family)